jgi:hypothetical protein
LCEPNNYFTQRNQIVSEVPDSEFNEFHAACSKHKKLIESFKSVL